MILYCLNTDGQGFGDEFFGSAREAIKRAREYGATARDPLNMSVTKIDVGKIDKAAICLIASGRGFALSQKQIWPKERATTE